jgi:hypothetical protein
VTTQELAEQIADKLLGTCDTITRYLDEHPEVDANDLEDALVSLNVERCKGCDWWHESCMLDGGGDDGWVGYCDDCRPKATED